MAIGWREGEAINEAYLTHSLISVTVLLVGRLGECTALTTLNLDECSSLTCLPDLSGVCGLKKRSTREHGPEEGEIGLKGLPVGLAEGAAHTSMQQQP